jgi:EAL domain-containing protein (putative c-di-GMP-specific phosphodiesterase class I)
VLTQLGCEMGQGFLFGRPAPAALLEPRLIATLLDLRPALTA